MKRQIFWSQVIGFVQRFIPACYAQAYAQGLEVLTHESPPEALRRSLTDCYQCRSFFIDSLASSDCTGLGFKFAIGSSSRRLESRRPPRPGKQLDKIYVKQKQATLRRLCAAYAQPCAAAPANTLIGLCR